MAEALKNKKERKGKERSVSILKPTPFKLKAWQTKFWRKVRFLNTCKNAMTTTCLAKAWGCDVEQLDNVSDVGETGKPVKPYDATMKRWVQTTSKMLAAQAQPEDLKKIQAPKVLKIKK